MTWRTSRYKEMVIRLLKNNDTLVFLDTETVGLQKKCQIIQFSAIRYRYTKNPFSLTEVERINLYIRPDKPLPASATRVNGISNAFLSDYPDERQSFPEIRSFLSKGGILVGYRLDFDVDKIVGLFERNNDRFQYGRYIDVYEMAKDCIPDERVENYKLISTAHYYSCDRDICFHSSLDDVIATRRVFMCTLSEYLKKKEDSNNRERVQLSYCYYWENLKQRSMKRLVAVTSLGQIYYDIVNQYWGTNTNTMYSVDDIDMEHLQKQCFAKYRVWDIKNLCQLLKEKKREWEQKQKAAI